MICHPMAHHHHLRRGQMLFFVRIFFNSLNKYHSALSAIKTPSHRAQWSLSTMQLRKIEEIKIKCALRWNKDSLKQNGCGASTMPDLMPLWLLDCRHFHLLVGSRVIEISSAEISVFIQRKENQNLFRLITGFVS